MTTAGAMHSFWSSFGLAAFEENAVPSGSDAPGFPYITYELITDAYGGEAALTASLWYRGTSWVEANAKAEEIGWRIGYGGILVPADRGRIWIRRGEPFAQSMGDDGDPLIRRKVINVVVMYLTM